MSLYISIATASSNIAKSPIDEAITAVAAHAALEKRRGLMPAGPALDITFMLPGVHEKPSFVGMRMGGYTAERNTLFFETAVPSQVIESKKATDYVAAVMQDVVDNASAFFAEHNIAFDQDGWRATIDTLIRSGETVRRAKSLSQKMSLT